MNYFLLLVSGLITFNSLSSQIIDSVSYIPFPYVDSILYWHTIENRQGNCQYFKYYYTKYCQCDDPRISKEGKYVNTEILSEGPMINNKMDGVWIYWPGNRSGCCVEGTISPKFYITYDHGRKLKGEDYWATYDYLEGDSVLVKPLCSFKDLEYSIFCSKGNCKILLNGKYLLNEFQQDWLEQEINMIGAGEYNRAAKLILEKNPPLK